MQMTDNADIGIKYAIEAGGMATLLTAPCKHEYMYLCII